MSASCKIYPPQIPVKECDLPKFLPQQFPPYLDSDPNSIIKYKKIPSYLSSKIISPVLIEQEKRLEKGMETALLYKLLDTVIEPFTNIKNNNHNDNVLYFISFIIAFVVISSCCLIFLQKYQ